MQRAGSRPVTLAPLVAITFANYAAQVPYFLHNDYSAHHPLPSMRAVALLGATLAWFTLGLAGFLRHRRWGFVVLTSFLAVEAIFYAKAFATGAFLAQLGNHSFLLKAVFIIGYASGAAAAYYAYRILLAGLGAPRGISRASRDR